MAQAPAGDSKDLCKFHIQRRVLLVEDHPTTVDLFVPDGAGPFPLVFMIHGSAGVFSNTGNPESYRDNFGEHTIAQHCFLVVLPHYFEALGLERKSMTTRKEIESRFEGMILALDSLLKNAARLPEVRGQPVFLFGESIGGYIGVALALRHSEVRAISEFGGGLPSGHDEYHPHPLNVFISHGADDTIVLPSEAQLLSNYCKVHEIPFKMDLYQGQSHYFSPDVQRKIVENTISFFRNTTKTGG